MDKRKKLIILITIISFAVMAGVIGIIMLPNNLVVQITSNGTAGNYLNKFIVIPISVFISVIFAGLFYASDDRKGRNIFFSLFGLGFLAIIMFLNF